MLKLNSKGSEVANWQRFLVSQGYKIIVDGEFGPKTEIATKDFQKKSGLYPDGKVGQQTFKFATNIGAKISSSDMKPPKDLPERIKKIHPVLFERAKQIVQLAKNGGHELIISQGYRSFEEQDKLFAKRPKVTNARGGQSMHNYGLAVDFAFKIDGKISWDERLYKSIGHWSKIVKLTWGGNWKFVDLPHCELPNLPSYRILRNWHDKGGLNLVWKRVSERLT